MTAQTGFAVTQPVKPRLQDRDRGVWRTTRNVAQPRPEKAIMDTRTLDFGFLPEPLSIEAGPVTIRPLDHLEKAVAGVMTCPEIVGDWMYSPMAKESDGKGWLKDLPYPSRIFRMPTTHSLAHDSCDDSDQLTFLLWAVSFFKGIRLTAEEAGFLDATSIKTGILVDFVPLANSLQTGIAMADAFWIQHRANPKCTKLVAGIVHALFLSQNPQSLQFERFTLLYQALDACFALSSLLAPVSKYLAHGARVAFMCRKFDMPVPEWAEGIGGGSPLSILRNDAFHEALIMDQPLGFAVHGVGQNGNLILEMQALICRFVVALIGGQGSTYVRSPINTRQRHGLTLL